MHATLTVRGNIMLAAAWGAVLAVCLYLSWPRAALGAALAVVVGVFAGTLQARALAASSESFRAAASAIEVRKAMVLSSAGKASVALIWLVGIAAVVSALALDRANALAFILAVYAAFALARELSSLGAIRRLENPS